jgi:hypothetical protein
MTVALRVAWAVLLGAAGVVEESREDDLLKADKQGRYAQPEVLVRDFCVAVEMATGVEKAEDELYTQMSEIELWSCAEGVGGCPYSLYEVREDDEFEADQFCEGLVVRHVLFKAAVELQDGDYCQGYEDGAQNGNLKNALVSWNGDIGRGMETHPNVPKVNVVGRVAIPARCLGSFLRDEQDRFDHRIDEDDNPYVLENF